MKYDEKIVIGTHVIESRKMTLWERFLLLFKPKQRMGSFCEFKTLGSKVYIIEARS